MPSAVLLRKLLVLARLSLGQLALVLRDSAQGDLLCVPPAPTSASLSGLWLSLCFPILLSPPSSSHISSSSSPLSLPLDYHFLQDSLNWQLLYPALVNAPPNPTRSTRASAGGLVFVNKGDAYSLGWLFPSHWTSGVTERRTDQRGCSAWLAEGAESCVLGAPR